MTFIELCRRFISIDSSQSQGTSEIVDFLAKFCRKHGLNVEIQEEQFGDRIQKNIIIRLDDKTYENELMLQSHLDTSDPGIFSMWTKTGSNPFDGSIYGDTFYGLGAAKSKLDFLCKIQAMIQLKKSGKKYPVVAVGTFDGSAGMSGAIKLIRRGKIKASHALVGHPTEMTLVNASFGLAVVEISVPFSQEELDYHKKHDLMLSSSCQSKMFYGETGASTQGQPKQNAIVNMMEYLAQLPDGIAVMDMEGGYNFNAVPESSVLEFDLMGGFSEQTVASRISRILNTVKEVENEFLDFPCEGFFPNIPTINIGLVKKKKDHIRFIGSCRLTPNITNEQYEIWMRKLHQSCQEVGATFQVVDYKSAFKTKDDSPFLQLARKTLKDTLEINKATGKISECTEASVFHRMGIECLVFGAGKHDGNAYEPNESVDIEDLKNSVEFYQRLTEQHFLENY
ncbi:MAG: M20/M25/M40 family metallo-hydrolase [Bdellovibrionales bacterium]